jgi:hypothetical protein
VQLKNLYDQLQVDITRVKREMAALTRKEIKTREETPDEIPF